MFLKLSLMPRPAGWWDRGHRPYKHIKGRVTGVTAVIYCQGKNMASVSLREGSDLVSRPQKTAPGQNKRTYQGRHNMKITGNNVKSTIKLPGISYNWWETHKNYEEIFFIRKEFSLTNITAMLTVSPFYTVLVCNVFTHCNFLLLQNHNQTRHVSYECSYVCSHRTIYEGCLMMQPTVIQYNIHQGNDKGKTQMRFLNRQKQPHLTLMGELWCVCCCWTVVAINSLRSSDAYMRR